MNNERAISSITNNVSSNILFHGQSLHVNISITVLFGCTTAYFTFNRSIRIFDIEVKCQIFSFMVQEV